jgi:hypothetical protein
MSSKDMTNITNMFAGLNVSDSDNESDYDLRDAVDVNANRPDTPATEVADWDDLPTHDEVVENEVVENEVVENEWDEPDLDQVDPPRLDVCDWPALGQRPVHRPKAVRTETVVESNPRYVRNVFANGKLATPYKESKRAPHPSRDEIVKSLERSKACYHVLPKTADEDGNPIFGVCYREHCTFAHSLDEFQLPPCSFGDSCYRINGTKVFKTGKVDRTNKCAFLHPFETVEKYYQRTGAEMPNLPPTNENSRKPNQSPTLSGAKRKREAPKRRLDQPRPKIDLSTPPPAPLRRTAAFNWSTPTPVTTPVPTQPLMELWVPRDMYSQTIDLCTQTGRSCVVHVVDE